jgi:hypothetical protein
MSEVSHRSCDERGIRKEGTSTYLRYYNAICSEWEKPWKPMDCILAKIQTEYPVNNTATPANSVSYSLTKLSPSWGAASCAATQKLNSILWNPKVQYRVHKSPPLIPILSHINPIHTIPSYLSKIHPNVVHPPMSQSSQCSLSFWFDIGISVFHSCAVVDLWQSLSEWHLLLYERVLVCCCENVGASCRTWRV